MLFGHSTLGKSLTHPLAPGFTHGLPPRRIPAQQLERSGERRDITQGNF
jgi:hypothetical protein